MTVVASPCRCGHTHRTPRHASETTTTTRLSIPSVPILFVCVTCEMDPSGQHRSGAAQRRKQRATRAAVDLCGPGHVATPLSPTGTEEGQGWGGGFRVELYGEDPEASPSPGDRHSALSDGRG